MSGTTLIQVPYYLGREHPSLSRGPAKLAEAIGGEAIVVERPEPSLVPNEVAESFQVMGAVSSAVRAAVQEDRFPLVLAVNCFTSLGTVAGLGRDVGVVWFDAHGDFHSPDSTKSGFLDGMGLAMLLGVGGWHELRRTIDGLRTVPAENVVLVGSRDIDSTEEDRLAASPLRRAELETLDDALEELAVRVQAVYVHIDLDVIDASVAHANALSVEGGPGAEELEQALESVSGRFEIAAAALTAYDPNADLENRVPPIAASLARRLTRESVAP